MKIAEEWYMLRKHLKSLQQSFNDKNPKADKRA